jgi:hypothetical protein
VVEGHGGSPGAKTGGGGIISLRGQRYTVMSLAEVKKKGNRDGRSWTGLIFSKGPSNRKLWLFFSRQLGPHWWSAGVADLSKDINILVEQIASPGI